MEQVHATVNRLHAWGGGLFIDDPSVQIDGAASWDAAGRTLKVAPTNLTSSAVVLKATETTLRLPTQGPPSVVGAVAWQADLSRIASWVRDPRTQPASTIAGHFTGQATLWESASTTTAQLTAAIDNLVVAFPVLAGGAGRPRARQRVGRLTAELQRCGESRNSRLLPAASTIGRPIC